MIEEKSEESKWLTENNCDWLKIIQTRRAARMRKKIQEKDSRIYHFYRNPISRKKIPIIVTITKKVSF